jgi:hypothetical protein
VRQLYSTELAIAVGLLLFGLTIIFALVQSPHVSSPEPGHFTGDMIPHPVEGLERCDRCHGPYGISPYPENHRGWSNPSCLYCHEPGPQARN